MYSLRNQIKELGVEEVLKMVSKAGYSCVEFAGFYGMTPVEMKNLLDKYNLEGISAHIGLNDIESQLDYIPSALSRYFFRGQARKILTTSCPK